ncbi:hypothetical protein Mal4_50220 [Maioricimonas rarisocia]|uniref:Teichoic acid biosynthesis protein n=1 Tax=Maioricimonas rarisocia TaxID=2528026 RepID=A0A517ZDX8_9PLAN|nr:glycosyltransferase family protein [Maioricimonas rarisocia]QDU40664.1 hypothetical protein Mal4_50220 [Maioricimonas rarisocia]
MATILYSLAGEGRGHATRVRTVVEALRDRHRIEIFAPGVAYDLLSRAYQHSSVTVRRIPGLLFHYSQQRLDYLQTISEAGRYLAGLPQLIRRLRDAICSSRADLVITDFEPALPRAALRESVPFISLDHQHFLTACDLSDLPLHLRAHASIMSPVVGSYYQGQAATIISSFYFPPVHRWYRDCVVQAGVLLRPEIRNMQPVVGNHLLVYLRRFAPDNVMSALASCRREVRIYGLGERPAEGNLKFFGVSEHGFLQDLATCQALISNAGNQLIGEAMFLGKPVLAIPEARNFEQFINAFYIRQGGGGDWCHVHEFGDRLLSRFLEHMDEYRGRIDRNRLDGLPTVLDAVESHLPALPGTSSGSHELRLLESRVS